MLEPLDGGAGAACAYLLRADAHDGEDFLDGAGDEGFVGLRQLLLARAALLDGEAVFAREREDDVARQPTGAVMILPSLQRKKLLLIASVISPSGVM